LLAIYNSSVYSPEVLDHFQNPRNVGAVLAPDASAQLENPVCGDVLKLTVRVEGNRIAEIRFLAKGCVPVMACASAITEMALAMTPDAARKITREELIQRVGGLTEASSHAAHLAVDALRVLLSNM